MVEIRVVSPVPEADVPTLFAAESLPGDYADITWSFGDGGTGTGTRPSHEYAEPGEYTVEVDVFQGAGFSQSLAAEDRITVDVIPLGGQAPVDDPVDEPPESGIDPTPGTSRDELLGIVQATAAEGNGIGSDTPGIQPQEKAKAQVRRESDGKVFDFFFQAPAEPGVYERAVDFGDVDTTATYEVEPFPDDADTGGGGTAPEPEPGPGPLLSIPKPTLESVTFSILGQDITIPEFLTFGSETFDVRLPSFSAYLQTANLGFDLSEIGFRVDQLTSSVDDVEQDIAALQERVETAVDRQVIDRIDRTIQTVQGELREVESQARRAISEAESAFAEAQDAVGEAVAQAQAEIDQAVAGVSRELGGQIDRLRRDVTDLIDREVQSLRSELLGVATDLEAFQTRVDDRIRGLLPVTPAAIEQAVADVRELRADEAFQSFLSDPRNYVFATFRTEFESRIGDGLLGTLRRILNSILESAISDDTRQRLRDRAGD
jgi:PKD repeat protein